MKLNPDHPTIKATDEQWYKIAALLMMKMGIQKITITQTDLEALGSASETPCIVLNDTIHGLELLLLPESKARALARAKGENL